MLPTATPIQLRAGEVPRLFAYRPDNVPADQLLDTLLIFPGGSYRIVSDNENYKVAEWALAQGMAAFVLVYRVAPEATHPNPLNDTLDAIRHIRAHASEYQLSGKVAVLGFSAGGHAAATLSVRGSADPATRPDATLLIYPVVTMREPHVHPESRKNLIGPDPLPALADATSAELHVSLQTPPAFIVHGYNDSLVQVENALLYAHALRAQNIPFELHIFADGPHGFCFGEPGKTVNSWAGLAAMWLKSVLNPAA